MFGGKPAQASGQPHPLVRFVFMTGLMFSVFLLLPLFLFVRPYHAIRERAASFNASPNCINAAAASAGATTPCTMQWANVMQRYDSSASSRSSKMTYRYYLQVRGGYGDQHIVELKDESVWWRIRDGDALKLQRWGDRITAVQLQSGESSPTAENPDWQLGNDVRGLRAIVVFELVMVAITLISAVALRQLEA